MSGKTERQKTKIVALLGNPTVTYKEIAQAVGCSTKTVQRIANKIKPDLKEVHSKLAEYQALNIKHLPIAERVELRAKIARKADRNPFAALRAIERFDDLDGVTTEKDRLRVEEPEGPQIHRPLFNLPPGAQMTINIQTSQEVPPVAEKRKAIDVTAERSAEVEQG